MCKRVTDGLGKAGGGRYRAAKEHQDPAIISFITKEQGDYYFHGSAPTSILRLRGAERQGKRHSNAEFLRFKKTGLINLKLDRERK